MVNVKIYVEGGGDSKEQHVRCRNLAQLNPETLSQYLPYFRRFITTLDGYL